MGLRPPAGLCRSEMPGRKRANLRGGSAGDGELRGRSQAPRRLFLGIERRRGAERGRHRECEAVFLSRLTQAQKRNYQARQQRCSDKYAREDGSLAVAEAALCAEAIAVSFARNAAAAGRIPASPLAPVKASFNCGKARTKLEQLICSSDVIGGEDIDLSAAYQKALGSLAPDARKVLVASESGWLTYVAKSCIGAAIGDYDSKSCAEQAFSDRADQLKRCMFKSGDEAKTCLNAYAPVVNGVTQTKP